MYLYVVDDFVSNYTHGRGKGIGNSEALPILIPWLVALEDDGSHSFSEISWWLVTFKLQNNIKVKGMRGGTGEKCQKYLNFSKCDGFAASKSRSFKLFKALFKLRYWPESSVKFILTLGNATCPTISTHVFELYLIADAAPQFHLRDRRVRPARALS